MIVILTAGTKWLPAILYNVKFSGCINIHSFCVQYDRHVYQSKNICRGQSLMIFSLKNLHYAVDSLRTPRKILGPRGCTVRLSMYWYCTCAVHSLCFPPTHLSEPHTTYSLQEIVVCVFVLGSCSHWVKDQRSIVLRMYTFESNLLAHCAGSPQQCRFISLV